MSARGERELLHGVSSLELAARVEAILAKAEENKQAISTPTDRYWSGWHDAMGWVVRALNGERPGGDRT
jgi:hypothetical protein